MVYAFCADFTAVGYHGSFQLSDEDGSKVLPVTISFLTSGLTSIFGLISIAAAVMSSADSSMLSAATMVTRNVYHCLIRPYLRCLRNAAFLKAQATEMEVVIALRTMVCTLGAFATYMALSVRSVFELWTLCSDIAYVLLFPQLLCVFYFKETNAYGSVLAFTMSALFRCLCGEPTLNVPVFVKLPLYDPEAGQRFPFRFLCMALGLCTLILGSSLATTLFRRGWLPERFDVFRVYFVPPELALLMRKQSTVSIEGFPLPGADVDSPEAQPAALEPQQQPAVADQLYYTTLLYEFYKIYEATDGKAFDEENLVHVMAGDDAMTAGPPSLRPTTPALTPFGPRPVIVSPAIDPAIFNDPTPIFGRTPISGITPDALSPGRPWPPVLTPVSLARTPPPEPSGPSPRPDSNLAPVSAMATCPAPVSATSPGPRRQGAQRPTSSSAPTPSVQTTPGGLTPNTTTTTACSASNAPSGSKRRGHRRPPAEVQDAVSRTSGSVTSRQTAPCDLTPSQYEGSVDPAAASRVRPAAEPSEAEGPASRVLKARRPKPPKPGGRKKQ
ncbi:hypothetical protein V5799_018366 [Amblyomma americanum]|uniref:Uncharacterized protein n=1 Tax=Amblyomma americanum TaxID=6943 RepID=A0AAQ4F0Q7_AMBAM